MWALIFLCFQLIRFVIPVIYKDAVDGTLACETRACCLALRGRVRLAYGMARAI